MSPGSGEGQPIPGTRVRGGEESGRPINRSSLPDPWLLIVGSVALDGARVVTIGDELGPDVARVRRLAHPLPSPLRREELLHGEDGPSRQHVEHGPSDLVRQDRERLPFAVLFLNPRDQLLPLGMAQEQHGRFGERPLQMDVPHLRAAGAERLPARLSSVHLTSRAYEANSCTRSKRVMSWIS